MNHCVGSAFATVERGRSILRLQALVAAGLAVALLSVTAEPADARYSRRWSERRTPVTKEPPPAIKGPLIIAVSIAGQRLTVYDDGVAIAQAPVSTGMQGHSTPTGVFSIIQKNRFHRSNIYSGAPMPFMQRITWSGVALHAGALPGYPASHGCIRLPPEFAARLWGMTKLGARVIVSRHDITPFDITHARLSALERAPEAITTDRHADALPPGPDMTPVSSIAVAIKTADASANTVATDAPPPPLAATPPDALGAPTLEGPASPVAATSAAEASPEAPATAVAATMQAVPSTEAPAAPIAQSDRPVEATPTAATDMTMPPPAAAAVMDAKAAEQRPVAGDPLPTPAAIVPDAVDQPRESAILPPAEDAEVTSAIDLAMPAVVPPAAPAPDALASSPPLAPAEPPPSVAALSIDDVFLPPSRPVRPLRQGPITIFVSRKDAKLYVRKRFDPLFSVPVTIARANEPIGTHVFTAAEAKRDGAGLRWIAMTLPAEPPALDRRRSDRKASRAERTSARSARTVEVGVIAPPATAAEALERIDLPADLIERIAALMSAGASLIVSDQGLGHETGLETDFIVLTR